MCFVVVVVVQVVVVMLARMIVDEQVSVWSLLKSERLIETICMFTLVRCLRPKLQAFHDERGERAQNQQYATNKWFRITLLVSSSHSLSLSAAAARCERTFTACLKSDTFNFKQTNLLLCGSSLVV